MWQENTPLNIFQIFQSRALGGKKSERASSPVWSNRKIFTMTLFAEHGDEEDVDKGNDLNVNTQIISRTLHAFAIHFLVPVSKTMEKNCSNIWSSNYAVKY